MNKDNTISEASNAAFDRDRMMTVGFHRELGWVYRDAEDFGGVAELTDTVAVDGFGAVQTDEAFYAA